MLARTAQHSAILTSKLRMKGFSEPEVLQALEQLQSWGYLDDPSWLESQVRKEQNRYHGPNFILAKLLSKRIPKDEIEAVLTLLYPEAKQKEVIVCWLDKEALSSESLSPKEYQKLLRRGFASTVIREVLSTSN